MKKMLKKNCIINITFNLFTRRKTLCYYQVQGYLAQRKTTLNKQHNKAIKAIYYIKRLSVEIENVFLYYLFSVMNS